MPGKRVKPKLRRRESYAAEKIFAGRLKKLGKVGLPAQVYYAVELLARQAAHDKASEKTTAQQWRVGLQRLYRETLALHRTFYGLHSDYQSIIEVTHGERTGNKSSRSFTGDLREDLRAAALDIRQALKQKKQIPQNDFASALRKIFNHYGLKFARSKNSLAVPALGAILGSDNSAFLETKIRRARSDCVFYGIYITAAMDRLRLPCGRGWIAGRTGAVTGRRIHVAV